MKASEKTELNATSSQKSGTNKPENGNVAFIFPKGYSSRKFTRENLSKLEKSYFDSLPESKDSSKAKVVLDKVDLCHQAGLDDYDDIIALLEGRATFEDLLRDKQQLEELRRRQCERQERLEEKREARRAQRSGECLATFPSSIQNFI